MIKYNTYKYNFDTAIDVRLNFEGFKFFSIFTDGLFNPNNNNSGCSYDSDFYLLDASGNKLFVNGEIFNLPLGEILPGLKPHSPYLRIKYEKKSTARGLGGGYGNIYVVLSNEKFYNEIAKKYAQITIDAIIAPGTHKYWLGERMRSNLYTLILPYLNPHTYMTYFLYTSILDDITATIHGYPYQCGDTLSTDAIDLDCTGDQDAIWFPWDAGLLQITNNEAAGKGIMFGCIFNK
jgi:hypothetical protein